MALSQITEYIKKYETMQAPDQELREILKALIERFTGIEVSQGSIIITRDTAHMRVSPVVKNQILRHQHQILSRLTEFTGKKIIRLI